MRIWSERNASGVVKLRRSRGDTFFLFFASPFALFAPSRFHTPERVLAQVIG